MSSELARTDEARSLAVLTDSEVDVLKTTICRGASDSELGLFLAICDRTGLDPFLNQIHAVRMNQKDDNGRWRKALVPIVGIDGLRVQAQRTQEWRGRVGPYWCGPDGQWTDVWLSDEQPYAAKVGVRRSQFDEPTWGIARWQEYAFRKMKQKDGSVKLVVKEKWQDMGPHMLAKCAEAGAIRATFPAETSRLYIREELPDDEAPERSHSEVETRLGDVIEAEVVVEDAEPAPKNAASATSSVRALARQVLDSGDVEHLPQLRAECESIENDQHRNNGWPYVALCYALLDDVSTYDEEKLVKTRALVKRVPDSSKWTEKSDALKRLDA